MSKRNLMEIASEGIEILIDRSLDDGLIKDIPFVGWVARPMMLLQA